MVSGRAGGRAGGELPAVCPAARPAAIAEHAHPSAPRHGQHKIRTSTSGRPQPAESNTAPLAPRPGCMHLWRGAICTVLARLRVPPRSSCAVPLAGMHSANTGAAANPPPLHRAPNPLLPACPCVPIQVPFVVPCGGVTYGDENLLFIANDWHTALLPVYLQVGRVGSSWWAGCGAQQAGGLCAVAVGVPGFQGCSDLGTKVAGLLRRSGPALPAKPIAPGGRSCPCPCCQAGPPALRAVPLPRLGQVHVRALHFGSAQHCAPGDWRVGGLC